MIEFLRESTFAVNEVVIIAWKSLKKHYFSIVGLCMLIFVVSALSGILGYYLNNINPAFSVLMVIVFALLYFILQITLLKYIFHTLDEDVEDLSMKDAAPSVKEMVYFFTAAFYFLCCILFVYILVSLLILPLIYTGMPLDLVVEIAVSIAVVMVLITLLRISFFPFFILDHHATPFQSIKMSLAITRGNFTKILILLGFFASSHFMYLYFNYRGYYTLSGMVIVVNSFLILPLSSVAITVAYRQMMDEYKGDADPDIIRNII